MSIKAPNELAPVPDITFAVKLDYNIKVLGAVPPEASFRHVDAGLVFETGRKMTKAVFWELYANSDLRVQCMSQLHDYLTTVWDKYSELSMSLVGSGSFVQFYPLSLRKIRMNFITGMPISSLPTKDEFMEIHKK